MIVNNTDLKIKYKNNLIWLNQTIQPRNVTTYTNWLDEGFDPVKYKANKYTDFEIYIDMLVKGNTKEECELLMSSLLLDFDSGTLQLDDMQFMYRFDLKSENRELIKRWLYHYEITLTAYCKLGVPENLSFSGREYTFNAKGTSETPAVISLLSDIGLVNLIIEGLTEEAIEIKSVGANSTILIDGENCTITENGENILNKTELWEFPRLKPGINILKLSSECSVNISYYPRYK